MKSHPLEVVRSSVEAGKRVAVLAKRHAAGVSLILLLDRPVVLQLSREMAEAISSSLASLLVPSAVST